MKISVITACFNAEATIGYTIESFLAQRHRDAEMIIVDGASHDSTLAVARSFHDDRLVIRSEPDRGIYDAMNRGLSRFSGDAVGFLNADDRFHDAGVLGDYAEALTTAPIVTADLDFVRDHRESRVVRRWRGTPYCKGAFHSGWMPAHPTFYVQRQVIAAVGRFDLSYRLASDYDYMLRAFELHDFKSRHLHRIAVDMMTGGQSTAGIKAYLRGNLESLKSRRRWLNAGLVDYALLAKPLRKLSQFVARGAAP